MNPMGVLLVVFLFGLVLVVASVTVFSARMEFSHQEAMKRLEIEREMNAEAWKREDGREKT